METDLARLGGPVRKQSAWVKNWRSRWLRIDGNRLVFFSEDKADGSNFIFDDIERNALPQASVLRRPTLVIDLASITTVCAVPDERFQRPHCFLLLARGGLETIALQAPSEEQRRLWLQVIPQAQTELAQRLEAARARAREVEAVKNDETQDNNSAASSAMGKGKGKAKGTSPAPPAPPGKGKGKAKGKGEEAKTAKGKGKAPPAPPKAAAPAPPVLPINRKLQLRSMDEGIDLNQTVFGAMLDDVVGGESGSSSNDESGSNRMAEMFRETFTPRGDRDKAQKALRAMESKRSKNQKAVFDRVVAQNAEIVLRRMPISLDELKDAIEWLDFDVTLTDDYIDRLREALPAENLFKRLLQFEHEEAELRQIEQKLMRLAPISRIDSRLRAIALKKGLLCRRRRLLDDVKLVRAACGELMESSILKDILQAVLRVYNFANHGVERLESGSVRGFDITTALKVADLKAESNNHTMLGRFNGLHFVVSQVLAQKPYRSSEDLRTELKSVFKASNLNLCEISRDARTFHGQAQFLKRELTEHRASYESESCENVPVITAPTEAPEVPTVTLPLHPKDFAPSSLPKLSPVPEDRTARRPETSSIVEASPRRWRTRFGRKASKMIGCLDVTVEGATGPAWIAEIKVRRLWTSRRVRWRRMLIDTFSHSLVIRGWQSKATFNLIGATIEPFSSARASLDARALSKDFPLGFEIIPVPARSKLHLSCSTAYELEWWLDMLRRQSSFVAPVAEMSGAIAANEQLQSSLATPITNCAIKEGSEASDSCSDSDSEASDSSKRLPRKSGVSPIKGLASNRESISPANSDSGQVEKACHKEMVPSLSDAETFLDSGRVSPEMAAAVPPDIGRDISDTSVCDSADTSPSSSSKEPIEASLSVEAPLHRSIRRNTVPRLVLTEIHNDSNITRSTSTSCEVTAASVGSSVPTIAPMGAVPRLNLQLGSSVPTVAPMGAVPRLNLQSIAPMPSGPCPSQSTGPTKSSTESIDSSEDHDHVSSAASETETDDACAYEHAAKPLEQLPTARLSVVQKLERLSEEVANVEVEVQSKVREASFQAAQAMRYFGQSVPSLEDGPESLESFGKLLHDFLGSVSSFLVRVDVSWRELERNQQQKEKGQLRLKATDDSCPQFQRSRRASVPSLIDTWNSGQAARPMTAR